MPQKPTKNQQMTKFHLPVVSLAPVFFFSTSSCVRFRHLNLKSCFAVLPAVGRKKIELIMVKHLKSWIVAGTWLDMTPWTVLQQLVDRIHSDRPVMFLKWGSKQSSKRKREGLSAKQASLIRILDISGILLYTNTTEFLCRLFPYEVAHDQWWFFDARINGYIHGLFCNENEHIICLFKRWKTFVTTSFP